MNNQPNLFKREIPTLVGFIIIGIIAVLFVFGIMFYRYWKIEKRLQDLTFSYQHTSKTSLII